MLAPLRYDARTFEPEIDSMWMRIAALLALAFTAVAALGASISTHVLDLARGVGGSGIPVVLESRAQGGAWRAVADATTDANGRIREFAGVKALAPGLYRLTFDMTRYAESSREPFFPEIVVVFRVADEGTHYHVPVVVSPYGYSTYRGN